MSTTALDLITGAAKLIGVTFKSEQLSADEAADGLVALNDMLDSWSNDNLLTYAYFLENFTLTGATSYTIGTGGNFNTTRPINIATAVVRSGSIDYPLEIMTPEQYQTEIALKSITSPIPQYLTYSNDYPLGIIKLYPVATAGTVLYLQSNKPLSNLSSLVTVFDLPPGWKRAVKYNLAIDLAPQYGPEAIQAASALVRSAQQSLGAIKRATSINNAMPLLPSNARAGNIFSGWYA